MLNNNYRGRFAPSPTGELHFGSLVAAVGSYLQAKSQQGQWLVRIEDVDQTRTVANSARQILQTLEKLGFEWDESVIYQSHRTEIYHSYLQQLENKHLVYPCDCSRNKLKQEISNKGIYPGYCREKNSTMTPPYALRCKTGTETVTIHDQIQSQQSVSLQKDCGDFIIKRRDQFIAYHLAVVVDDAEQGITDIIRGADLLSSTPQQIYLQQKLELATPNYGHLPVAMHHNGRKLSKSHQDLALNTSQPSEVLTQAMVFLGQSPPEYLSQSTLLDFWDWAIQNWDLSQVKSSQEITFNL